MLRRILNIILLLSFFSFSLSAKKQKKIEILNTDSLVYNKDDGDVRKLYGNVKFKHEGALMNCDSALFYPIYNSFNAYGSVKIIPNDTVTISGDSLHYYGNRQFAILYNNVELKDAKSSLKTNILEYDIEKKVAYYYSGGIIVSDDNILRSEIGRYYTSTETFFFKDSVTLVNKDYTIDSDTLKYEGRKKIAYFFGPTTIISDSNTIYCENGWYNLDSEFSSFSKNAFLITKGRKLWGDSLTYDRNLSVGVARQNVTLYDSIQDMYLQGDYLFYRESPEYCLVTDSLLFTKIYNKDTMFMHADTLVMHFDTSNTYRIMRVFNQVRFFKTDVQGKCDSLVYTMEDSSLVMHKDPVIWSEEHQITGEFIKLFTRNDQLHKISVFNSSYLVSEETPLNFNQVKGMNMTGYIENQELIRLEVEKNGETVYFMRDEDELIGVNKATCSNITVHFEKNEVTEIEFNNSPSGTLYPPNHLSESETKLQDFRWLKAIRPISKNDVFLWR